METRHMNKDWSSSQYLKFEKERTKPAEDLLYRISSRCEPEIAIDLGCGPGNSTDLLKRAFPRASIVGIDSSEDMITKAQDKYPDILFKKENVTELKGNFDVIFSNACLQWIPDHNRLLPDLISHLNKGGYFAAQIPKNESEPLFQIIKEVADEPEWGFGNVDLPYNKTLEVQEYFEILSVCASEIDIWETKYFHRMKSHSMLLEWVKGSRLRPYLDVLSDEAAVRFENEILTRVEIAYPMMKNGEIIFGFNRLFITSIKRKE